MTNEEALELLDTIPTIGEQVDALDMAIEALMRSKCEVDAKSDLISRAEAIEAVMAEGRKVYTSEYAGAERIIHEADAVEALSMLPSAEAVQGWIPCSERLPDNEEKMLCCTKTKKGTKNIVLGYYLNESGYWVCGMNSNVIAWMPLPTPYKGGEQNEDVQGL